MRVTEPRDIFHKMILIFPCRHSLFICLLMFTHTHTHTNRNLRTFSICAQCAHLSHLISSHSIRIQALKRKKKLVFIFCWNSKKKAKEKYENKAAMRSYINSNGRTRAICLYVCMYVCAYKIEMQMIFFIMNRHGA
jgi:hypothetical protein